MNIQTKCDLRNGWKSWDHYLRTEIKVFDTGDTGHTTSNPARISMSAICERRTERNASPTPSGDDAVCSLKGLHQLAGIFSVTCHANDRLDGNKTS